MIQPELQAIALQSIDADSALPIVIVGNGPVGMRAAQELINRQPDCRLIIYGKEDYQPYNRIRLSAWLAGEIEREQLDENLDYDSDSQQIEQRIGCTVTSIDRERKLVLDSDRNAQPYAKLILATGSSAYIPAINGVHKHGVFTFRDINDTSQLLKRQQSSRYIVVIGGGLLGLEAARSMQRFGAKVTLIEHGDRLLAGQLDEKASATLLQQVTALGIRVCLQERIREILGVQAVEGILCGSGKTYVCDTIVLATGIKPNIQIGRQARLAYGRGIRTNDSMQTSDPAIYAVGECAEHRERIYGLIAPGLEQAAVAAAHICGQSVTYQGSIVSSRLKVIGHSVFSMGPMGEAAARSYGRSHSYSDPKNSVYRKILVKKNRLAGAIAIGDWTETQRLQSAITRQQWIMPWQTWRFRHTGMLWQEDNSNSVNNWPAGTIVCQCMNVSRGRISDAIAQGAYSIAAITSSTGAGTVCSSCRPLLQQMTTTPGKPGKAAYLNPRLLITGLLLLLLLVILLLVSRASQARLLLSNGLMQLFD